MMHNTSGIVMGTSSDMRKTADVLDKVRDTMTGVYAGKSGKGEPEIVDLLEAETWLTAKEALAAGFVDEIGDEMDLAACARFVPVMAKAGFKTVPETLKGKKEQPTAREIERILRDGGCSERLAKVILAEGFRGGQRDVDPPVAQRDVAPAAKPGKDRVADLLTRAEVAAPSN
jgi:hypothetical protein